ncbi:MAG: biotin/lipoyl-binding protein [Hyphomicrobium sp.]|nr:biotin/lipoyl-binding protein [Hyphomicrobium sp.]
MQKSATEPDRETVGNVEAARAAQARRFQLRPSRRTLSILAIALLGPLVAAIAGGYYYFASGRYVATDNAYVKAHKIAVSADVAGRVSEVYVDADQVVQQATLLFRLDPQHFRIALDRAEAQLAAAI